MLLLLLLPISGVISISGGGVLGMSEIMGTNSSRFGNTSVGSYVDEVDESLSSSSLNIVLNNSRVSTSPEAEQLSTRFLKLSMSSSDSVGIKSVDIFVMSIFCTGALRKRGSGIQSHTIPHTVQPSARGNQTRPGRIGHDQPPTPG